MSNVRKPWLSVLVYKNPAYGRRWISRPMCNFGRHFWGPFLTATFGVHFLPPLLGSFFDRHFWGPLLAATFGVHFWPPPLGSTFDRHFWGPFLTATFRIHFWQPLLGSTLDRQWEAGIWSCDLRANERPRKKMHGKGTSNRHTDIATLWKNRPRADSLKMVCSCSWLVTRSKWRHNMVWHWLSLTDTWSATECHWHQDLIFLVTKELISLGKLELVCYKRLSIFRLTWPSPAGLNIFVKKDLLYLLHS